PTGKVFTNIGYKWRTTGRTFTIVGNACPLTRITTTAKVPLRKPIPLESNTSKPVVPVRRIQTDNGTEFVNQTLREYYKQVGITHETPVAHSPQQNGVVERHNRTLIEAAGTISGPALHKMTPAIISSGLVPKPTSSTPFVPPLRNDSDLLFQPLFDELLTLPPRFDLPAPAVIALIAEVIAPEPTELTGSPSSTTVDQDAPSPSKSQTAPETQPLVIPQDVKEDNHEIEVAHMGMICYLTCKDALTQSCWIEVMQEELNEFEHLEVWELVPRPDKVMVITLNRIYKVKLDELGAFADADYAGSQDTRRSTFGSLQFLGDILISWSSKRSKHINIKYHFIKEHVENGVIKLYFVNTEYQLADLFTKAFGRERIEFLINKLSMRSFTLETLKQLTDEVDE
nr:integrase, catalytic region, zinc finger, CCHC-type, peptidase aspartic, catalytic [Tanacetum cinerariifolium]